MFHYPNSITRLHAACLPTSRNPLITLCNCPFFYKFLAHTFGASAAMAHRRGGSTGVGKGKANFYFPLAAALIMRRILNRRCKQEKAPAKVAVRSKRVTLDRRCAGYGTVRGAGPGQRAVTRQEAPFPPIRSLFGKLWLRPSNLRSKPQRRPALSRPAFLTPPPRGSTD